MADLTALVPPRGALARSLGAATLAVAPLVLGSLVLGLLVVGPLVGGAARAQTPATVVPAVPVRADTARRDSVRRDTIPRARPDSASRATRGPRRRPVTPRSGLLPPVTPGNAFFSSLLVPGLGQARLQRPTAGAVFVGLEFGIIGMLIKSNADLRSATSFRADSVPASYPLDSLGNVKPRPPQQVGAFPGDLVRARRLHREDWTAALVFNHLISGAEAFVSANLYDLPAQITAVPTSQGTVVALSIRW